MHKIHTAQQQQLCRDAKGPLLALVEKQHSRHSDFHTNKWQLVLTHCKMGTGLLVVLVCGGMDRGAGKALPRDSPFANHSRLFSCAVDLPSKLGGVGGSGGGGGEWGEGVTVSLLSWPPSVLSYLNVLWGWNCLFAIFPFCTNQWRAQRFEMDSGRTSVL